MRARWLLASSMAAVVAMFSPAPHAGQLEDFETAATEPRTPPAGSDDDVRRSNGDDEGGWVDFFFDVFGELFSFGARMSLARIDGTADTGFTNPEPREPGAPELVFLRLDLSYQTVESDITGLDGRIEAGYGPFGLEYRRTRFREASNDALYLEYVRGLYRVSGSSAFEFDMALGTIELQGDDRNSGLSTALVFNIYPHPNVGLRLAPSWSWINGNPINDFDGSVAYIRKYFSLRAGYRRLQSHDEILHGPYAGISLHY